MQQEEWKPIAGFSGKYDVSSFGRVRRVCPYCGPAHSSIMVPEVIRGGYLSLVFTMCSRRVRKLIHVLVAEAFLGPRPPSHDVNHLDGDKLNPRLDNLEYTTRSANIQHSFRLGLHHRKLTPDQVRDILARIPHERKVNLAAEYGVSLTSIKKIANGQAWSHLG